MKSASKIITRNPDWLGPAIPPGEMLLEEFLKPAGIAQAKAAARLGISLNRWNEIVLGKRGITADTALRLGQPVEDIAAILDASSGRLGSAKGHSSGGAKRLLSSVGVTSSRQAWFRPRRHLGLQHQAFSPFQLDPIGPDLGEIVVRLLSEPTRGTAAEHLR